MDELTREVLIYLMKFRIKRNGWLHRKIIPNCKHCKIENNLLDRLLGDDNGNNTM